MRTHHGCALPRRFLAPAALLLSVAGCATRPVAELPVEYREVKVAVPTGCVVDRPTAIAPLNRRIPPDGWAQLAPGAKAEAMRGQAGERMNHADALAAATSSCADAPR